ncbi:MAG: hypothetical protein ACI4PF_05755 [Christensenellales bacterium]
MVKMFNVWYFMFLLIGIGSILGLYFLLKNRSDKVKKIVLSSILFFNLALHFLKILFPPYNADLGYALKNIWFINVCGTSVLFFPFIFLSKSDTAKDYMFYLGVISGFLAFLYPTEALGKNVLTFDLWRFYICHLIIIAVPLLMVLLKVHKLNFKRIWKIPFCVMAMLLFIICNQVLQSELGIISLRNDNMLDINYSNPSLIWGPTDDVAVIFSWLTPNFMKTVPFGAYAGQEKYWPFFWMIPGVFVYFLIIPFLFCLIFDFKNIKNSFSKLGTMFKKGKKANDYKNTENIETTKGPKNS